MQIQKTACQKELYSSPIVPNLTSLVCVDCCHYDNYYPLPQPPINRCCEYNSQTDLEIIDLTTKAYYDNAPKWRY